MSSGGPLKEGKGETEIEITEFPIDLSDRPVLADSLEKWEEWIHSLPLSNEQQAELLERIKEEKDKSLGDN